MNEPTQSHQQSNNAFKSVFIRGNFDEQMTRNVEQAVANLQPEQTVLPVYIDSYGGAVYSLMSIIDILKQTGLDIVTVAVGKAMSCGAILFAIGKERYAAPHSTIMVHEPFTFTGGTASNIQVTAAEIARLEKVLYGILDKQTSKPKGYWQKLCAKENLFLSAKQAKALGLATHIGFPRYGFKTQSETVTARL